MHQQCFARKGEPPGFAGETGAVEHQKKISPKVRERGVRMVFDHADHHPSQWAAITSISGKIRCSTQTLTNWVRQAERDRGQRPGQTSHVRERIKELEREVRELRQASQTSFG
jgi:transposase